MPDTVNDNCYGCITFIRESECSYSYINNENSKCPCSQCIVKVMCENMCTDFMSYRNYIRKYYMI
jgi:hypothetical protein